MNSCPWPAVCPDIDRAAVRLDDPLHDRQTQSRPLPLGREERVEYPRPVGRLQAGAVVPDGQADGRPAGDRRVRAANLDAGRVRARGQRVIE